MKIITSNKGYVKCECGKLHEQFDCFKNESEEPKEFNNITLAPHQRLRIKECECGILHLRLLHPTDHKYEESIKL